MAIENPNGSTRTGTDRQGKKWRSKMVGHYGYVKRTEGNDGDAVDVYIKSGTQDADTAYVIDQHALDGSWDEHKTILGATSINDARATYRANYPNDSQGDKTITAMPIDQFKDWIKNGDLTQPAAPQRKADRGPDTQATSAAQTPRAEFYRNPDNGRRRSRAGRAERATARRTCATRCAVGLSGSGAGIKTRSRNGKG